MHVLSTFVEFLATTRPWLKFIVYTLYEVRLSRCRTTHVPVVLKVFVLLCSVLNSTVFTYL